MSALPVAAQLSGVTTPEDWWENQHVVSVNKEDAHATTIPYATVADLKADTEFFNYPWVQSKTTQRQLLNGTWKFKYVAEP